MEELRKEIEELKRKVNQLERPTQFSAEFVTALVNAGFVKVNKILEYQFYDMSRAEHYKQLWIFTQNLNQEVVSVGIHADKFREFTLDISLLPPPLDEDYIVSPNHGMPANSEIIIYSTGNIPTPLHHAGSYYVVNPSNDRFQIAASMSGTPIQITDRGSGTLYYQWYR